MKTIKKIDIQAMKQADTICFRTENSISTVECYKKKSDDNPFDSDHVFNVESKQRYINYSYKNKTYCFSHHSMYDFEFCPLKTVISLLRENDTIQLVWYQGAGDTEDLKENGFVSDHLYIEIIRKDKVKYNFLIHVSTGRDNSARMIKHHKRI